MRELLTLWQSGEWRHAEQLFAQRSGLQTNMAVQQAASPLLLTVFVCLLFSDHFTQHSCFGLDPNQVRFFQQGFLPCLTEQGAVIMETPGKVM
jgi:hypothetical protein